MSHRPRPSGIGIDALVNPTREAIEFTAVLPNGDPGRLEIFDVAGRRLMSREIGSGSAGSQTVRWSETGNLAAGIYRIRLSQRGHSATAAVVLVR